MYSVVIDTLGSDKGPGTIVKGACLALNEFSNLHVVLTGDANFIKENIDSKIDMSRVTIIDAPDLISNYDHPVMAIKEKTNSSLVKALEFLKQNDDCIGLINAGSTGALLVGSMIYLKNQALCRPTLAAVLPGGNGNFTCIVDTGANVDCTSEMLVQFAHLGSDYMKRLYKIESPKVALLSNGAEDSKGNAVVKETNKKLREEKDLNFIGNFEGTNALSGECDVLVCDGFAGNQILKGTEGCAKRLITDIVTMGKKENEPKYLELAQKLAQKYDFNSLGGAVILGVAKPVIKAHGASNEQTIVNTVKMLINLYENNKIY